MHCHPEEGWCCILADGRRGVFDRLNSLSILAAVAYSEPRFSHPVAIAKGAFLSRSPPPHPKLCCGQEQRGWGESKSRDLVLIPVMLILLLVRSWRSPASLSLSFLVYTAGLLMALRRLKRTKGMVSAAQFVLCQCPHFASHLCPCKGLHSLLGMGTPQLQPVAVHGLCQGCTDREWAQLILKHSCPFVCSAPADYQAGSWNGEVWDWPVPGRASLGSRKGKTWQPHRPRFESWLCDP